jgi:hypothetical protein
VSLDGYLYLLSIAFIVAGLGIAALGRRERRNGDVLNHISSDELGTVMPVVKAEKLRSVLFSNQATSPVP